MADRSPSSQIKIAPQPGPQSVFLSTKADIAIFGGSAGSGKSFALLLEPLRHHSNPKFGGVIFRRSSVQVRNEGGLWHESTALYPLLNAEPRESVLEWRFKSGARIKFSHLEYDKNVFDWQGSQIPYIGFDELTHFTEKMFWYMLSRNRSLSGIPGYVRATTNPDADSWVRKLLDWWIGPDGFPIPERSGVIRYFIRFDDATHWGDSAEELIDRFGPEAQPKSLTFIPALLHDNKILMEKDPSYLANLKALSRIDRLRLLEGNWNARATGGMFFKREYFQVVDAMPHNVVRSVRAWDKAATEPSTTNPDPDWTRGVRMARLSDGRFIVVHMASLRGSPLAVERLVKNTASQDGRRVEISIAQDPGSAGVADMQNFVRLLAGYIVRVNKPSADKITRAKPLSAQSEAGNILLLRGDWNEEFLTELENFDGNTGHDDIVDASADAFNELASDVSILSVL